MEIHIGDQLVLPENAGRRVLIDISYVSKGRVGSVALKGALILRVSS